MQSMFNTLITYDPVGIGMPYNHVFVPDDAREQLVQVTASLVSPDKLTLDLALWTAVGHNS